MGGGTITKILIHAVPKRLWYVEDFLMPELRRQGADMIDVFVDRVKLGNLEACMQAFNHCKGHGGTWHLQDDVLPASDFVERAHSYEADGVVYGFCNEQFTDDPQQTGRVYVSDSWHSFQCVRIPDKYARDCAQWFYENKWQESPNPEVHALYMAGKGDDTFFREYMLDQHGRERVTNAKPNLVEHVDWIVGGSILHPWRGYLSRAYYWDDEQRVNDLKAAVKGKVQY